MKFIVPLSVLELLKLELGTDHRNVMLADWLRGGRGAGRSAGPGGRAAGRAGARLQGLGVGLAARGWAGLRGGRGLGRQGGAGG
jgi:hypothetical protein